MSFWLREHLLRAACVYTPPLYFDFNRAASDASIACFWEMMQQALTIACCDASRTVPLSLCHFLSGATQQSNCSHCSSKHKCNQEREWCIAQKMYRTKNKTECNSPEWKRRSIKPTNKPREVGYPVAHRASSKRPDILSPVRRPAEKQGMYSACSLSKRGWPSSSSTL